MALVKIAEGALLSNDIPAYEALANVEITNRFIKLAESIKRLAPRSDDFLYFSAIFMHAAEASLIDPKTGEPKTDSEGKVITGGFDDSWKWSCSDASIDPYHNQNLDIFPEVELKKAYKKWQGRPLCINHQSSDVEGVRGIIIDTYYDDKYKRVVGLIALDKKSYPDLAHKVKTGYASSVSMGTAVGRALCTVCQQAAISEKDYCNCVRSKKGQRINGVKVGEINLDLSPIELSLVVTPADQQAKVLKIIASLNNYTDQRASLLEEKDHAESKKLATLDHSIKNVETQLNRLFAECSDNSCQFVRGADGHIQMIKAAQQVQPKAMPTWNEFFHTAKEIDEADDYEKRDLFDSFSNMRRLLKVEDLRDNPKMLIDFTDVMASKNKYLHEKLLQPILEELKSTEQNGQFPPMQDNQFTTPNGADKDLGLDMSTDVMLPADEQQTGDRIGKVVNPSEKDVKPNKGGDTGPELGSPSDRFQFGNYASNSMAEGGKTKQADLEENLNLLLKQTQEIEHEMNKMKHEVVIPNNKSNGLGIPMATEEIKMNEARLKLRAAQRAALLKQAEKEEKCEECEKVECECEEKKEKKAYWQGTEEPKPGQVQYKPDNGGEPKTRMNDKQMKQDKSMGGADGSFPGDEAEKKKLLRAELEQRALQRRAYWQGTEEPKPGQEQYKKDPLAAKDRMEDKQMKQDKSMGGADGSFPGDEAEKKKLLRAELTPGILRTKFSKKRNADGSLNKQASVFEVFAGNEKLLSATASEIYGEDLEQAVPNLDGTSSGKTAWDVLSSPEYGKEVMAAIREQGFEKVAGMLKGAQAAMPELPPGLEAPPAADGAKDAPKMKNVDVNELMALLGEAEDKLGAVKQALVGSDGEEVKDMSVETQGEGAPEAAELTASILELGKEVYAELDKSADELALLVDYFGKSASLSAAKKNELNKLATDAMADSKSLLEEADTILVVAGKGKIPPGLKAFQDKKKKKDEKGGKDKDKDEEKDEKKGKDKKDDKKDKKDDKKKKSKKAELVEALLKLANDLDGKEEDELEKDMKELGLLPEESAADDVVVEHAPQAPAAPPAHKEVEQDLAKTKEFMDKAKANKAEDCGMCGMAMDAEHACTASAKEELVREALATRRMKREALLKAAEGKLYDVVPDTHGLLGEAHKGAEANPATELDVKPAGVGAVVEGLDKKHDAMMGAAEAAPTGKEGSAAVEVKEAAIRAELATAMKEKKAEEDKSKFRVKLRRAYDLALMMQEKGMISRTKESLDKTVDDVIKFSDEAFESYKRVVANTQASVKTASKNVPHVGVREDNSQTGDNTEQSLGDVLRNLDWK